MGHLDNKKPYKEEEIIKTKMKPEISVEGLEKNIKQFEKPQGESNTWQDIFNSIANTLISLIETSKTQNKINEIILEKLLSIEAKLGELESRIEKIEKSDKKEE